MTTEAPLERMQKIADFRTTCRFLRRAGGHSIFFGGIYLLNGAQQFQGRALDALYFVFGALEVLNGLHNRFRPSAVGLVLDGILLLLLGGWIFLQQAPGNPSWFGIALGVILILVSSQRFHRYRQVRDAFAEPPTEEQVAWFDDVVAEIKAGAPDESPDMIEFRAGLLWKGRRLGDVLIFVDALDFDNLIVDRRDTEATDKGKALFGSARNVALRIGRRTFPYAEFAPEQLARLGRWRTDEGVEGDGEGGPPEDEDEVPGLA